MRQFYAALAVTASVTALIAVSGARIAKADDPDTNPVCVDDRAQSAVPVGSGLDQAVVAAGRYGEWKGIEPKKCDTKREFLPEPDPNEEVYAMMDRDDGRAMVNGEEPAKDRRCPSGTQRVGDFCMDQYLGSLVAVYEDGSEGAWSPFHNPEKFKNQYNNSAAGCAFDGKFKTGPMGPQHACLWGPKYKGQKKIARFRSVSIKGAIPQTDVSRFAAEDACKNSGKRLCTKDEWLRACQGAGPAKRFYPYPTGGTHLSDRVWGQCADMPLGLPKDSFGYMLHAPTRKPVFYKPCLACRQDPSSSACKACPDIWDIERKPFVGQDAHAPDRFVAQFGDDRYGWGLTNACVAEVPRFVDRNGAHPDCHTPDGDGSIYDLMGNKHEWENETLSNGHGVFRGGYMDDTVLNGPGCYYATVAHGPQQADASTGFRCCADLK